MNNGAKILTSEEELNEFLNSVFNSKNSVSSFVLDNTSAVYDYIAEHNYRTMLGCSLHDVHSSFEDAIILKISKLRIKSFIYSDDGSFLVEIHNGEIFSGDNKKVYDLLSSIELELLKYEK